MKYLSGNESEGSVDRNSTPRRSLGTINGRGEGSVSEGPSSLGRKDEFRELGWDVRVSGFVYHLSDEKRSWTSCYGGKRRRTDSLN